MVRLGSLVSGVVDRITSNAVVVHVNASGFSWGTISIEHLADHHGTILLCLIEAFPLLLLSGIADCSHLLCRTS